LLDENSIQSASGLDRGLNDIIVDIIDDIIVKRLYDMQSIHIKGKWIPHYRKMPLQID